MFGLIQGNLVDNAHAGAYVRTRRMARFLCWPSRRSDSSGGEALFLIALVLPEGDIYASATLGVRNGLRVLGLAVFLRMWWSQFEEGRTD